MTHPIAKNKTKCLKHRSVIKQRTRKGYTQGEQEGIFYSLWCKECNHHIVTISHDQAWSLRRQGAQFEDLHHKITNSVYKDIGKLNYIEWQHQEELLRQEENYTWGAATIYKENTDYD